MAYCRTLKFEQEPDYKVCMGFFEQCMKRNKFDPNVHDYTWKQNRLEKDKQALKNSIFDLFNKKPANKKPGMEETIK